MLRAILSHNYTKEHTTLAYTIALQKVMGKKNCQEPEYWALYKKKLHSMHTDETAYPAINTLHHY